MKKSIIKFLGVLILIVSIVSMVMVFTACDNDGNNGNDINDGNGGINIPVTNDNDNGNGEVNGAENGMMRREILHDRVGNPISVPEEINRIISLGASNTEILAALGFADRIIYADMFSNNIDNVSADILLLDMMAVDAEFILNAQPDIIFATDMILQGGTVDPLGMIADMGVSIIYVPISSSISDIMEDIRFIAAVMSARAAGEAIIADMQAEIESIQAISANIPAGTHKTVYFEISPPPWMTGIGTGTFLHEMLGIIGAVNIFADQDGWIPVSDEVILPLNPDVILTSTNFLDDPIADIAERPGWDVITAVQNGDIFQIDADSSNRPSHNIVKALREMAQAIYPDLFS